MKTACSPPASLDEAALAEALLAADNATQIHTIDALLRQRVRRLRETPEKADVVREIRWLQHIRGASSRAFNELAVLAYEGKHPKHWLWRSHKQYILDRVKTGDRVLDVGCGASAYLLWMAQQGCHVVACDINPDRITLASSLMEHENLRFETRDAVADPPSGDFNWVICAHVIEHIDEPVPFLAALKACAPRLIVCVPPDSNSWEKVTLRDLGLPWKDDEDHRREYTPDLLRKHIAAAGWRITDLNGALDIKATAARSTEKTQP